MTESAVHAQRWNIVAEPVTSDVAAALFREYYTELADRHRQLHEGRKSSHEEIESELSGTSSDDLLPPSGVLLLGRYDGEPAGCAGLRTLDSYSVELKRMFVRSRFRGTGGGGHLLSAIDTAAREFGAHRIVLDTRLDLVEARALYRKHGYTPTAPYNTNPRAEAWYCKPVA